MPGTLMLINPAKRRRPRRKTAAKRRAVRRRRTTPAVFANPVRRRRSSARKRNPIRAHRRRRNPINMRSLQSTAMDAFKGAAGALAVNAAMKYLPLPASMVTGYTRYATRAALAIGLGVIGKRFLPGGLAAKMAEGALTVIATDLTREVAAGQGIDLSGVGYYSPAINANPSLTQFARPSLAGTGAPTRVPGVIPMRRNVSGFGR